MSPRIELTMVALSATLGVIAAQRIQATDLPEPAPPTSPVPPLKAPAQVEAARLQLAAAQTSNRDPFRLSRQPAAIAYVPGGVAPTPVTVIVVPQLTVRGIVGGPPWQAVIDGIPGAPPGSVVKNGAVFDRITFVSVGRDTVVVQLADSVWRITMSRRTP